MWENGDSKWMKQKNSWLRKRSICQRFQKSGTLSDVSIYLLATNSNWDSSHPVICALIWLSSLGPQRCRWVGWALCNTPNTIDRNCVLHRLTLGFNGFILCFTKAFIFLALWQVVTNLKHMDCSLTAFGILHSGLKSQTSSRAHHQSKQHVQLHHPLDLRNVCRVCVWVKRLPSPPP